MNPREHMAETLACGLAGDLVRTFGQIRLRVVGTSMVPSILPGDLISVQRAVAAEISSGESVLYVRDGRMVVHRVVGRTGSHEQPFAAQGESFLITRGDRLRRSDPPVSSSELLGKVISIQRGGREAKTISQPGGFACPLVCLLQFSDRATCIYLKMASLWEMLAARTFSRRRHGGKSCAGANVEVPGVAGTVTHKSFISSHRTFDAQLRPLENEGAARCQA
jgi:signal peptidase I